MLWRDVRINELGGQAVNQSFVIPHHPWISRMGTASMALFCKVRQSQANVAREVATRQTPQDTTALSLQS